MLHVNNTNASTNYYSLLVGFSLDIDPSIILDDLDRYYLLLDEDEESDDSESDNEGIFPPMKKGDALSVQMIEATERYTRPPARYTEASLVKQLEELGIGRPSTRANIIETLFKPLIMLKNFPYAHDRSILYPIC